MDFFLVFVSDIYLLVNYIEELISICVITSVISLQAPLVAVLTNDMSELGYASN